MLEQSKRDGDQALLRGLGRWDLFALVINGIVGAGIYGLPAKVQSLLGAYAIIAILICGAIMALIILCFSEVSSRFDDTGGPFLYAGSAMGPLAGFLSGWMLWIARVTGACAICNLLLQYLAYLNFHLNQGGGRITAAAAIIGALIVIHCMGIKRAALFGNVVTVGKLVPLAIFVAVGLFHLDSTRFVHTTPPSNAHFADAILLLAFAFMGWESVVVAAGETRNPRRDLPLALIAGLGVVVILYVLIQVVCLGTLAHLAISDRPLLDAARGFLGAGGAILIVAGAAISMVGTLNAAMLPISRLPYAMAVAGQLPRALAAIHPRYRTPYVAVLVTGLLVFGLTVSGGFTYFLTVSTLARLLVYAVTCASLPILRQNRSAPASRFTLPGGVIVPCLALMSIMWLIANVSHTEILDVTVCAALGALIYAARTVIAR